jgi:putative protein-disulfide isomerase
MKQPNIIYCFDAYCGWCYGFSPVMKQLALDFKDAFHFEVLSGGMIVRDEPLPISSMAAYIKEFYPVVEKRTGIRFGSDYLWHIEHPDLSDWYPDSEKAAIALCVFKEFYPDKQVEIAATLQYALHFEGRDLCDDEAYRHLTEQYHIPADIFYDKLHSETYKDEAHYEFALCRQLQVSGFPTVFLQTDESKFYLLARGYTDKDVLYKTLENVLKEWKADN